MTKRFLTGLRIGWRIRFGGRVALHVVGILVLMLVAVACADPGGGSTVPTGTAIASPSPDALPPATAMPSLRVSTPSAGPTTVAEPTAPTPTPLILDESGATGRGVLEVPVRVRIPRIAVDAEVEAVGLAPNGEMAAPRSYERVGWFGYGSLPGEPGASVIAGHVDSPRGPAVFWSLQHLQPGDQIEVDLAGGATVQFVVEGTGWYATNQAPLDTIFTREGPPRLNLVTCAGTFDHDRREYSHRLVVYARSATSGEAAEEQGDHVSATRGADLDRALSESSIVAQTHD